MAQIIVYGHKAALAPRISSLSDAIHAAAVSALQLPLEKRFHRFITLDPDQFITPSDRSIDRLHHRRGQHVRGPLDGYEEGLHPPAHQ